MKDIFGDDDNENKDESFAELFEEYSADINDDIQLGDRIEGKIISIGAKSAYIDTGSMSDGVVEKKELLDEDGELLFAAGDVIELYVVSMNESEIILSKSLSGAANANMLNDAYATRTPVEGNVKEVCKGGFNIEIAGKRAFCPVSQIDVKYVEKPEEYIGETFTFIITRFEEKGRNIIVSRRDYLNIDIERKKNAFFEEAKSGDILDGTITKLMPFGAFVELFPGLEGLVHISELAWSRVEKPEEAVSQGDVVKVKLLSIQKGEDSKSTKISLSIKQTLSDPWETAGDNIHVGDQLTGTVTRLMPFGAFVEIVPGTEGLVHLSEMSYTKRILKADDVVSVGETIQVVVKQIELDKKRISLSIKDAHGDPWNGITLKYPLGKPVTGTIEKKEQFGFFISIEPGVTALLPKVKINQSNDASAIEKLKIGMTINVIVSEIDEERRRMSLSPTGIEDQGDWKEFAKEKASGAGSMGSMGDLLQAAMNKKK